MLPLVSICLTACSRENRRNREKDWRNRRKNRRNRRKTGEQEKNRRNSSPCYAATCLNLPHSRFKRKTGETGEKQEKQETNRRNKRKTGEKQEKQEKNKRKNLTLLCCHLSQSASQPAREHQQDTTKAPLCSSSPPPLP